MTERLSEALAQLRKRHPFLKGQREEAIRFLSFAHQKYAKDQTDRWIYVVYLLALNAGLRAGEIWGLKPRDLLEGEGLIHIQRQHDLLQKDFRPTKGKENRRVPCNQELLRELRHLIAVNKLGFNQTFFQNGCGNPVDHNNFIYRTFKPDLMAWGGKPIRFHDLRHTAITLMTGAGLDLKTVQEIAGHKDIKTTIHYVHLLAEKIKEAARVFSVTPEMAFSPTDPKSSHLRLIHYV